MEFQKVNNYFRYIARNRVIIYKICFLKLLDKKNYLSKIRYESLQLKANIGPVRHFQK